MGGEGAVEPNTQPRQRGKNKAYDQSFEEWWAYYPRHEDKQRAARSFHRVIKNGVPFDVLVEAARRYAADPNRIEQFTKLASTWLNAGSWENGALPDRRSSSSPEPKSPYEAQEEYREWAERYAETGEA